MATVAQIHEQLAKVRVEVSKLTQLLDTLDKEPAVKKTTAK